MWSVPGRERVEVFVGATLATVSVRARASRAAAAASFDVTAQADGLTAWLVETLPRGGEAAVVVSDHWVRHAWVPGAAALRKPAERSAAAAGTLRALYGDRADDWTPVLGSVASDGGAVACGIDGALLAGVRQALASARVTLRSVEPLFAHAFNRAATQGWLDGMRWFVSLERGRAVIVALDDGRWTALRSQRLATVDGLPAAIELARLGDGLSRSRGRALVVGTAADVAAIERLPDAADFHAVDVATCLARPEAFA